MAIHTVLKRMEKCTAIANTVPPPIIIIGHSSHYVRCVGMCCGAQGKHATYPVFPAHRSALCHKHAWCELWPMITMGAHSTRICSCGALFRELKCTEKRRV